MTAIHKTSDQAKVQSAQALSATDGESNAAKGRSVASRWRAILISSLCVAVLHSRIGSAQGAQPREAIRQMEASWSTHQNIAFYQLMHFLMQSEHLAVRFSAMTGHEERLIGSPAPT